MGCCEVTTKVLHHQSDTYFEVEEAGKEGIGLVWVDIGLAYPIVVQALDPSEIIIRKVLSCDMEWT